MDSPNKVIDLKRVPAVSPATSKRGTDVSNSFSNSLQTNVC